MKQHNEVIKFPMNTNTKLKAYIYLQKSLIWHHIINVLMLNQLTQIICNY